MKTCIPAFLSLLLLFGTGCSIFGEEESGSGAGTNGMITENGESAEAPTGGGQIGFGNAVGEAGGSSGGLEACGEGLTLSPCTCQDGTTGSGCMNSAGQLTGECECGETLEDIPCSTDEECPAEQPICSATQGQCVQCADDAQCGIGTFCVNGVCKQNLCTAGENACNGNQLQVCNDDGTSFELFDCAPGVCQDGTCIGCELGTTECLEGNVVECVLGADGDPVYEEVEVCTGQAQCYQGSCLECFPGQGKCEGQDAYQCAADGKNWEFSKKCSAGESCIGGVCQGLCTGDIKFNTNVGCDYWAVDLDNVDGDGVTDGAANAQFAIVVSNPSDVAADITVRSKDDGAPTAEAVVEPGGLQIFDLAPYNVDGTVKTNRAWRLQATAPIVAYQFNPLENELVYSNDASVLFPSNSWGTEYLVMSRQQLAEFGRSFFTVVAGFDATEVTVTVTSNTLGGPGFQAMNAGESRTVTLEPYEILNVESDDPNGDLTGSRIVSSQPVGVFGGHECAVTSDQCCCDHLEQMMIPTSAWGKTYVASRSAVRGVEADYWRILATEDGTQISTNPHQGNIPTLSAGQFWEIKTSTNFLIQSNKPIMVGQYLASSYEINGSCQTGCQNQSICDPIEQICLTTVASCNSGSDCPSGHTCVETEGVFGPQKSCEPIGDPAFILGVPIEQFRSSYVFLIPNQYLQDYVNVITPVGTQLIVDGTQTVEAVPIPAACSTDGTCWATATLELTDGTHSIESLNGEAFGVVVYGYDDDVSYGYPGGLDLKTIND